VFWKDPAGKQHGRVFRRMEEAKTLTRGIEQAKAEGA
jgi:hypothetical protein